MLHSWDTISQLLNMHETNKMKMREKNHCIIWNIASMLDWWLVYDSEYIRKWWRIKNQLTTKYLRSVFIIMLFVCAINPFLVICQYGKKFIISFCFWCAPMQAVSVWKNHWNRLEWNKKASNSIQMILPKVELRLCRRMW